MPKKNIITVTLCLICISFVIVIYIQASSETFTDSNIEQSRIQVEKIINKYLQQTQNTKFTNLKDIWGNEINISKEKRPTYELLLIFTNVFYAKGKDGKLKKYGPYIPVLDPQTREDAVNSFYPSKKVKGMENSEYIVTICEETLSAKVQLEQNKKEYPIYYERFLFDSKLE